MKREAHTHTRSVFPLTVSPSVSLMKAECVGTHSRHAWLHTVNPPEQHAHTATCEYTHTRTSTHCDTRNGRKLKHNSWLHTHTHTHGNTHFREGALCTWLWVSPSVSLSLSLSPHLSILPLTCKCSGFHLIYSHWGIIIFGILQTLSHDRVIMETGIDTTHWRTTAPISLCGLNEQVIVDLPSFNVVQEGDFNVHQEWQQRYLLVRGPQSALEHQFDPTASWCCISEVRGH